MPHSASCRVPQKDRASVKGPAEDNVLVVISEFRDGGPVVLVGPQKRVNRSNTGRLCRPDEQLEAGAEPVPDTSGGHQA